MELNTNHFLHKPYFIILMSLFSLSVLKAQIDDPLTDHVPIEYIKYVNSQPTEGQEAVITDTSGYDNFNLGVAFAEPHLVQNPKNPLQYFTSYNTNTAYRTNDAFTWTSSAPSFGATTYGDPVNAYDSLGNLFYENMSGSTTIQNSRVIKSTDNGSTWSASVVGVLGVDKNWIAADQTNGPYANYIYSTMTSSTSGSGNFHRSTDNGVSFTQTKIFNTQSLPGMMVAVGPNTIGGNISGGCVYVVTNSGSAYASTYTFYVSTDGGLTFTSKSAQNFANYVGTYVSSRNSVQNMRTRPYPFIAADNSFGLYRGRLYLVYASNTPSGSGNKPDIFCRFSDDQGATWSTAVVVNDDAGTTANNQWHPSIWCDKTSGRLFIKWMDTRDTPTSDSAHIYASYSDDGGLTFAPNQRITTAKMKINCSTCGGGGTPRYQGDYDAIASINNQALMAWTDFRAGSFGSYVGFFPDYAMKVIPAVDTVFNNQDSTLINVSVPGVKLYNNTVTFSAVVEPLPAQGAITVQFPNGNTLSSFPGIVPMSIKTSGSVTVGIYTITISGVGSNGTPVHKRTVTLNVVPVLKTLNITALVEGFFNGSSMMPDTISVELRNTASPFVLIESRKSLLNSSGTGTAKYSSTVEGTPYYVVIQHRNSIETWSAVPQSFVSGILNYDFTTAQNKAYGNNLVQKGTRWCIYSGDVNKDGFIDGSDVAESFNESALGLSGYAAADLNGDEFVDGSDVSVAYNNNNLGIGAAYPTKRNDNNIKPKEK